jgi:hypothetical protein
MNQKRNPAWWNQEHESAWDRIKAAFQRDWEQTKHDFGGKQPDIDQDVDDTVKQAAGKQRVPPPRQATFEENEDAYRFGYGARSNYSQRYPSWNNQLESDLEKDWRNTYSDRDWQSHRDYIRQGWDYDERSQQRERRKAA